MLCETFMLAIEFRLRQEQKADLSIVASSRDTHWLQGGKSKRITSGHDSPGMNGMNGMNGKNKRENKKENKRVFVLSDCYFLHLTVQVVVTPSGGLEPPTSRLTVERASQLRHEEL